MLGLAKTLTAINEKKAACDELSRLRTNSRTAADIAPARRRPRRGRAA